LTSVSISPSSPVFFLLWWALACPYHAFPASKLQFYFARPGFPGCLPSAYWFCYKPFTLYQKYLFPKFARNRPFCLFWPWHYSLLVTPPFGTPQCVLAFGFFFFFFSVLLLLCDAVPLHVHTVWSQFFPLSRVSRSPFARFFLRSARSAGFSLPSLPSPSALSLLRATISYFRAAFNRHPAPDLFSFSPWNPPMGFSPSSALLTRSAELKTPEHLFHPHLLLVRHPPFKFRLAIDVSPFVRRPQEAWLQESSIPPLGQFNSGFTLWSPLALRGTSV